MNVENTTSMTPNTYRRLLAAHGRSSTLGIFDCSTQVDPMAVIKKLEEANKLKKPDDTGDIKEISKESKKSYEEIVSTYLEETSKPPKDAIVNPPLSKAHNFKPKPVASSYSFYQRPFKVNGKDAWEFAMRDLGSIDTLLNRYGYVEPQLRGRLHNAPEQ